MTKRFFFITQYNRYILPNRLIINNNDEFGSVRISVRISC